ncbi:HAMP domain-containing sensor histidine kinase [Hymenobacter sp. M29]|uniref:histidine kinase n=1 Tax=Hymenobacter mellowenesis TaxID=3063995 RepID=A0ABT9AB64_9BACT|nr:HAMP domain-containing sensor histidine kinase [Hymenobacter sp. M29]MDO7847093.1 HAMP domain-containing sensor histidine kinase [Hymenobacter sp. M29]
MLRTSTPSGKIVVSGAAWRRLPWLLLLGAAVCFIGGYLASRYAHAPGVVQRTDVARLQQLVRTAENQARREADTVAARLPRGNYSFRQLLAQTTFPTCILENGTLRYWSDAALRPEAEAISTVSEQLIETSVGQTTGSSFLLLRRMAGRFTILTYVPLVRHYGIKNRYLSEGDEQALFRGLELKVVADSAGAGRARFEAADGHYLFSIESLQPNPLTGQYVPLALLSIGSLLYAAGWLLLALRWWRGRRAGAAVAALVAPLAVLRWALLYLGLPFSFIELPLFDPRVYTATWWAPSLGDLLLDALLALLVAAAGVALWRHWGVLGRVRAPRKPSGQLLAAAGLGVAFCGWLAALFVYYTTVFGSSQLSLDVSRNLQVTGFWLLLALATLLHTAAWLVGFFGLTQLAGALLQHVPRRALLLGPALVALPVLGVGVAWGLPWVLLIGVLLLFASLVRSAGLQAAPTTGSYQSTILIVLLLALTSATGALALYAHFEKQLLIDKQRLAGNMLIDNDLQGEFLLGERMREIAADPFVRRSLSAAFGRPEVVRQRVSRQYLGDYFDKYESTITLYDEAGDPIGAPTGTPGLVAARTELEHNAAPTDQKGVYLVNSANPFSSRRYVAYIIVPGTRVNGIGLPLGAVRVELTLKKLTTYSVLPELLVDQKFFQPGLATELSYAGYDRGRLVYSEGDFDYANRLPEALLADTTSRLYVGGLSRRGYHHLAVQGSHARTVVVTTATYSVGDWLANFSFQFLLSSFFWLLMAGIVLLLRGRAAARLQLNFSTRIQLLLNVGIVVPLLVVSIATASQLIDSYKRDLSHTYERRGQLALESLRRQRHLLNDSSARPTLAVLARNVAALTETDLNLYDAHGELLASSQPLIFDAGLLGPLLNPQAMVALDERNRPRALLTEKAGSLSFNALYLPVRASAGEVVVTDLAGHALAHGGLGKERRVSATPEFDDDDGSSEDEVAMPTGPILGYVGIPFFDSEKELNTKLTELFTTILNIFTPMFLLFLGLAYVAARQLTAPLKLITEKLTKTTLTGENELLDYRSSDDEIGLLVREYNTMLTKLEASKRELAAQEKEAAWREMARQVAHEIKNPLTPMKLSLQFLQKAINERRPNAEELIGRISQTLITQIDVLSDIATSFSTFTNLPTMRPERLDVAAVLRRCAALHQPDASDGALDLSLPPDAETGRYVVYADENLLVRTFNNLLINARQAVPEGREPHIDVSLAPVNGSSVRVVIRDNGAGIPDEVREKVFVPNFTTKETGSGIGLAVAKRGIESAGGKIWFETEVGEGTNFFIELPLAG